MSKFKLINIIDKLFVCVCIFFVLYAWICFYVRNVWLTLILCTIFSSATIFTIFYIWDKKHKKQTLLKQKTDDINKYYLGFKLLKQQQKIELINKIYSITNKTFVAENYLIVFKQNSKSLIFIETEKEKITQNDLYNLASNLDDSFNEMIVICENYTPNIITNFLNNVSISLINKSSLYTIFSTSNIFPDISNINTNTNKINFKVILKGLFVPQKAKSYFTCGIILIFSAIILPYHVYYLIFGSTLLCFCVICKLKQILY